MAYVYVQCHNNQIKINLWSLNDKNENEFMVHVSRSQRARSHTVIAITIAIAVTFALIFTIAKCEQSHRGPCYPFLAMSQSQSQSLSVNRP